MCYLACLVIVLVPLLFEAYRVRRARKAVPIRIHVHGTRGKTSAVKKTAARLRASGLKVLAKTTGDAPELIYPDGHVEPIRRYGSARIAEQVRILLLAEKLRVECLVIEGMALQRETLAFSERIIRATHMVIVNVREDHAETMGFGRASVAETIALALPERGHVFFSREAEKDLRAIVEKKGLAYTSVEGDAVNESEDLAKAVADALLKKNQDRESVLSNCGSRIEPIRFTWQAMPVALYDFFSANDVESTALLKERVFWKEVLEESLTVAFFSTRSDRPLRTLSFMRWLKSVSDIELLYTFGSHRHFACLYAWCFVRSERSFRLKTFAAVDKSVLTRCVNEAKVRNKKRLLILCMGNCHGAGEAWRDVFASLGETNRAH